jgi:hypothetical protein
LGLAAGEKKEFVMVADRGGLDQEILQLIVFALSAGKLWRMYAVYLVLSQNVLNAAPLWPDSFLTMINKAEIVHEG